MAITLKFRVTDYHSNTFEAIKSAMQLDDMRDSEDVKLVLEKLSNSDDVAYAKLVAQKSKGMPLISISLTKLLDNAARDCMANMSFGLFKAFKCMKNLVVQEKEHSLQLTKNYISRKGMLLITDIIDYGFTVMIFELYLCEDERSENIQRQLGKRQKLEKMNSSDKLDVSGPPASNGAQNSPDKLAGRDPASTKVTNRVVPAFRRAKVRGALLQDIEDDKDNLKPT
ncbi:hypothetical protein OIU77_018778 [Salix suchowensis]|uniref:Uncharacterized protein n=1 Tax=Salix suchowensis TaxID=1278906 RepID=A0ABQ9CDT1_9ROSI|nr:hypothetical protein OIU77_018778 [Salix suchowensis]